MPAFIRLAEKQARQISAIRIAKLQKNFAVRRTSFISSITGLLLLAGLSAVGLADDSAKRVLVVIVDDGEFEVLHSRAKTTLTGVVFFGLIGYGVEESSRVGEDNDREEQVLAYLPTSDCRTGFDEALVTKLADKGYDATIVATDKEAEGSFDRTIRLKIRACGFKLANSTSDDVSAFYAASYAIDKAGEKPTRGLTDMLVTGTFRADWPGIVAEPETAAAEFESIRTRAGRRIANRLIYERE